MTQRLSRIFNLGICILLLAGLIVWPEPVQAGESAWSAENIPSRTNNLLGPPGIDMNYFVVEKDGQTVYSSPCNTDTANVVYKSTDGGINWTAITTPISVWAIAIAPDDDNIIAILDQFSTKIYLSGNGGVTWQSMGTVQEASGGAVATYIYDIQISALKNGIRYIAAIGHDVVPNGNVWYFRYGDLSNQWHQTRTLAGSNMTKSMDIMAFSPDFDTDATLAVVTSNATFGVKLQLFNFDNLKWNNAAGYLNFPRTIINDADFLNVNVASMALDPTFTGIDPDNSRAIISLTVTGTTPLVRAKSGIYLCTGTTNKALLLNTPINNVYYNGDDVVAGAWDNNRVYRCANPLATTPVFTTSSALKSPGGGTLTFAVRTSAGIIAGTFGDNSDISLSVDNGATFDSIAFIDTTIATIEDVAVTRNSNKAFLATDNGSTLSLWRFTNTWRRVLSIQNTKDYIVRSEPVNGNEIYLVKKDAKNIYQNNGSGTGTWYSRASWINIHDMAVEGNYVAYIIEGNTGKVSRTADGGLTWSVEAPTGLASGATIISAGADYILAGSQDGFVAYSGNASTTWNKIPVGIEAGAGNVTVIPDANFVINKVIYVASDTAGQNVMKWTIGSSTAWTDIFNGTITGGVYGLAVTQNILYALEYDGAQSTLWRHVLPPNAPATSTEWSGVATTVGIELDSKPQALKASTGKLWAIKTNGVNGLYSYTDSFINIRISVLQPMDGFSIPLNFATGLAYDLIVSWNRASIATQYQLLISFDENFLTQVYTINVASNDTIVSVTVGPSQAGVKQINFIPGTVYYWKVRTTKPGFSDYSPTRHFTIAPMTGWGIPNIVPTGVTTITSTSPALSWKPLYNTTEYQFILSETPDMISPLVDTKVNSTVIQIDITLECGKTYFWQVRATEPVQSDWSPIAVFNVAEKPPETTPLIIITKESAPQVLVITIPPPEETIFIQPETTTVKLVQEEIVVKEKSVITEDTPGFLYLVIFILLLFTGIVFWMTPWGKDRGILVTAGTAKGSPGRTRKLKTREVKTTTTGNKETPMIVDKKIPREVLSKAPAEKAEEGITVIFAARGFLWMMTEKKESAEGQSGLSEEERQALGEKIAIKIQDLTKRENLYIKYPADAAMLLNIWAQYGSRLQTEDYLAKTFKARPENALRLLKCYSPASPIKAETIESGFTMKQYNELEEVIEPEKVYAVLIKAFKFKDNVLDERAPVRPADRELIATFIRIYIKAKNVK